MNQEYKDGDIVSVPEYAQHFGMTEREVWNRLQRERIDGGRVSNCGELTAMMRAAWIDDSDKEVTFDFIRLPVAAVRRVLGWTDEAEYLAWTLPDLHYTFRAHRPSSEHIHVMVMRDDIQGEHAAPAADKAAAPGATLAAPVVAVSEPEVPAPLTTGDIAFCFAGLHWITEKEWKNVLGKGRDWTEECVAAPAGGRGRGVAPKLWNPVLLAAKLVERYDIPQKSVRARFQNAQYQRFLRLWLDAWKTYEADNLATE